MSRSSPSGSTPGTASPAAPFLPQLTFEVVEGSLLEFAAAPTLRFLLRLGADPGVEIRSVSLGVQIRIAAARRGYLAAEQERLVEVFGQPSQWAASARSLFWAQVAVQVPGFVGETRVEAHVPCTYDFEVVAAKYFRALEGGDVPLEFLFSGTTFYAGEGGQLRAGRIAWDRDARFPLPVRVWRETMDHYFPNAAWLRLRSDVFDRLYAYRTGRTLATWDDAIDSLLATAAHSAQARSP